MPPAGGFGHDALPHHAGVAVTDAPRRVEYLVWSQLGPAPAAAAFLNAVGVPEATIAASVEKRSRVT